MKKENLPIANARQLSARVTRAQATKQQEQKRLIGTRSKRNAFEENKNNACVTAPKQNKRRAVLRDVTNNVLCANSYKNCFNASKIPGKKRKKIVTRTRAKKLPEKHCRWLIGDIDKQMKKCPSKISKVAPTDAENVGQLPADSKAKGVKETVNTELNSSKNEFLEKVESNEGVQPSESVELPSKSIIFSMRGKKVEKVGLFENLLKPKNPDVTDIDTDIKNPLLCSFYAPEIYVNLRVAELIRRPTSDFMETVQRDITQSMRGILVDWLVEVSEEYKLVPDTLYLTVHLIDLFLSHNYIERQRLQLLGITCMLIASKYEEICAPRIEELCFITDNTYTKEEVLALERKVLNYLGFRLSVPTAKTFIRRYLRVAQASYEASSLEFEFLANYLSELTLVDYELVKFLPSVIAASVVFLARWTLKQSGHPWNVTLEHYTSYKATDLKTAVFKLQSLQLNTAGCPLNAIRAKYRQDKFKAVAALSSPELLQTLF